ncbi:hypothetical protein FB446DRAFT_660439 [Lentinula raphanica]|nr:hypothetical protein C8R42DRAFT_614035 [Lentinula raphanica]KAJ3777116.1 hypothetical protein FB446DRAFT_660439 [Lentinula raphanica]
MDSSSTPCSTSSSSLRIVSDLYYPDGNLIIENENSTFKVYSRLLAQKSTVFRDMFTFPQPTGSQETPTVRLYDSTEDLTWFLKAILDPEFFEPPPTKTDLSIVGGILRLSTKYDVQFLRRRAILHVRTTYPSTLEAWKGRDTHRSIPPVDNSPFAILPLIHEFELDWALPAVLYCLCSYNINQIIDGVTFRTQHYTLSEADKRKVLIGRAELVHLQNKLSFRCLRMTPHGDCPSRLECAEQFRKWLDHVSSWDMADPLDYLDENWGALEEDLCVACLVQTKEDTQSTQREIWDKLPALFDLQEWTVLRDLEDKAMDGK